MNYEFLFPSVLFTVIDYSIYNLLYGRNNRWQLDQLVGFGMFLFQTALFPYVDKMLGPIIITRIGRVIFSSCLLWICCTFFILYCDYTFTQFLVAFIVHPFVIFLHVILYVGFDYTSFVKLPLYSIIVWVLPLRAVKFGISVEKCLICKYIYDFKSLFS